MTTVHAIIACHNRRELTLEAVRRISRRTHDIDVTVTLFDDGSTDGTADAVNREFPTVEVLHGDGNTYWAKSMALAESFALARANPDDFILWMNDDVEIEEDLLTNLVSVGSSIPHVIVTGSTTYRDGSGLSYSGLRRVGRHPMRFERVTPNGTSQTIETFNGNLVLVPVTIARALNGIDGGFAHGLADIDYGLRAKGLGFQSILVGEALGRCDRNEPRKRGSTLSDWKYFLSPKGGGEWHSNVRFLRRHGGSSWPLYFAGIYIMWWARRAADRHPPPNRPEAGLS